MKQRFIQSFNTSGDVQTAVDNKELGKPYVAYVEDGQYIDWNSKGIDYAGMPLTFEIISGGKIIWKAVYTDYGNTIEYSTNNGETWTSITSKKGAAAPSIPVSAGDTVQFRGDNATYSLNNYYNTFSGSTAKFEVKGNIMSLIDSTNFSTATTLTSGSTFYYLFSNCTGLTSAENLVLPATTLADNCYRYMFYECRNLATAPELPATTLANNCYAGMFYGCTSLTTAPELPATTLQSGCYTQMFRLCSSLNFIKCLIISNSSYAQGWVFGVSPTGTFVKHPNATWPTGESGIPTGWTVIDAEV